MVKERLHVIVIKIESLGDTTGDYLPGFGIGKYFLGHRKYEPQKKNIDKLDFIKRKRSCTSEEQKKNKQATVWEKYSQSMYLMKNLHSGYIKNSDTSTVVRI